MTILVQDTDRSVGLFADSLMDRIPLLASAICFVGSAMSFDVATGFAQRLVAGQPFAGWSLSRVEAQDWLSAGGISPVNGGQNTQVGSGEGTALVPLAAVQLDVVKRRKVYFSDDATPTFVANGNTLVGTVIGIKDASNCYIKWATADMIKPAPGALGVITYADAATTVALSDLDKVIHAPITAGRTYTLPLSADCEGHFLTFVNTGGAFALTIGGAGGTEDIAGATTLVQAATKGRSTTIYATGVVGAEWAVIGNQ